MKLQRRGWLRLLGFIGVLVGLVGSPGRSVATFPGLNGRIAYHPGAGIHTMNPDGTNQIQLGDNGMMPTWSADGTKIAFGRTRFVDQDGFMDVYVMDADGSHLTLIVENGRNPTWSPDGKQIAFWHYEPGQYTDIVYVINVDGSNMHELVRDAFDPAWSPDGTKIAFTSIYGGIFVINPDGTGRTNLADKGALRGYEPNWSPDSRRIVYSCLWPLREPPTDYVFQICVTDADGSNTQNVSNHLIPDSSGITQDTSPAWSPDAKQIAFTRFIEHVQEVFVMNADGSNQTRLTFEGGFEPDWQPLVNAPPVCTNAQPTQAIVWPPNHGFAPVQIQGVTDPNGNPVTITVGSILQDEAATAPGTGNTSPDAKGLGGSVAQVRAERSGPGDGRVYHIRFTAYDGHGGTCTGEVRVGVPKSVKAVPVDGGALYDSTAVFATAATVDDTPIEGADEIMDNYVFLPVLTHQ